MKKSVLVLTLIFALFGCSDTKEQPNNVIKSNNSLVSRDIFAMDTYMSLKAYGENAESALEEAALRITELEDLISVTDEDSDIWKINNSGGKNVTVSDDTIEIIDTAIKFGDQTDGALDITVYPVTKEWGFTTGEYKIPDEKTLDALLSNVDYTQIHTDGDTVCIPQDVQIDLGALAKGYTSDSVMEILREHGVESAVISLGGNVQTLGKKPDGSLWSIAVADPFNPSSGMCIVSIENKAVITSGNYERYFIGEDGKSYWHIIDSNDGYPADNGLVSVTIIGDSGLMCDTLSTALFVEGLDNAIEYWRNSGDFDMILVTDDNKLYITEGIEESVQITNGMMSEVIRFE